MLVSALLASGLLLIIYIADCLLRPLRRVRGIPTIPSWVALLPLVRDVDQQHVFNTYIAKPLRKHGAVKIFFAAQWNILLHRPEYIAEIFKREDVFHKRGNYKKIPHSVLSALLGDNIISNRGETWKLYRRVIKPGLQLDPDLDVMIENARLLCNILVESQARGSGIQESIQRYTIANFAQIIFNVDFGVSVPLVGDNCWLTVVDSALSRRTLASNAMFDEAGNLQTHLYELSVSRPAQDSQQATGQIARFPLHRPASLGTGSGPRDRRCRRAE
jgi:hypothetical protein